MKDIADEFKRKYDEYELINEIGEGVWRIRLKSYDKICILKKIDNPHIYRRLQMLGIKGIPAIYDVFEKEGSDYVIEEYINGSSLSDVISSDGAFNKKDTEHIIISLCAILQSLHKENIIHRDIKPSNIILTSESTVYLIDFGIARSTDESKPKDTRHLGTEFYASPEQYGFAQTDNKSDIYSLGKLMAVLLSGKESTENIDMLPFGRIIKKCIEVDPSKRYADAVKLKNAFGSRNRIIALVMTALFLLVILIIYANTGKPAPFKESAAETASMAPTENSTEAPTQTATETVCETTVNTTVQPTEKQQPQQPLARQKSPAPASPSPDEPAEQENKNTAQREVREGYAVDTLLYDKENYFRHIYYDDAFYDTYPYMNVYKYMPKQSNTVQLGSDVGVNVFADETDEGINIEIEGSRIFIPNEADVHYNASEYPVTDRVHTLLFTDMDNDGLRDILSVELAYYSEDDSKGFYKLYVIGTFVKINADLSMNIMNGEKIVLADGSGTLYVGTGRIVAVENGKEPVYYRTEDGNIVSSAQ